MTTEAVVKKLNALPQNCVDEVSRYVDWVSLNYENSKSNRDVSNFFGSMKISEDPLEIQKKLRDEWE